MNMPRLTLTSPAKINLILNLLAPRDDGYHEVSFVMQTIALADTLTIEAAHPGSGIVFTCSDPTLSSSDNLVVQAFYRYFEAANQPEGDVRIHLEKRIPVQAGLGGGSSNAATALMGLQQFVEEPIPGQLVHQVAASLGSDVSFFLTGGTSLATGRGETITPLVFSHQLPPIPLLVVKPRHLGISTPKAFELLRAQGHYETVSVDPFLRGLPNFHNAESLDPYLHNDFEPIIFEQYPEVKAVADKLQELSVERPLLCGSGPTMAGFLRDPLLWQDYPNLPPAVVQAFPTDQFEVFLTHTATATNTSFLNSPVS
ncbi:MAG: 4-(cytidine 5'-diphospho)-2-C-methyl-D-erythritol kinase [Vampirovibrio sp.]|nr:4-(cytidine 5'-diphospho)-2-C-methyl-D-erythritol kinase [Vampirovibrio sp.]